MRILFISCLFMVMNASGQDAARRQRPAEKAIQQYEQEIGYQSHLYNGTDFQEFPVREEEHPYFLAEEFLPGSILFRNQLYEAVDLMYNLVSDRVIVEDGATKMEIELIYEGVASFTVQGHSFEKVTDANSNRMTKGFYEVLSNGNTRVLVRHEKQLQHTRVGYENRPWYEFTRRIYIEKRDDYFLISSKKSLESCFRDKATEVKQHLRQKKLRFRRAPEETCKEAAAFYDSLLP